MNELEKTLNKTPGELIDALITTDIKIFMLIEKEALAETYEQRGIIGEQVLELNRKRANLTRALDYLLGFGESTVTAKTYLEDKGNDLGKEF